MATCPCPAVACEGRSWGSKTGARTRTVVTTVLGGRGAPVAFWYEARKRQRIVVLSGVPIAIRIVQTTSMRPPTGKLATVHRRVLLTGSYVALGKDQTYVEFGSKGASTVTFVAVAFPKFRA